MWQSSLSAGDSPFGIIGAIIAALVTIIIPGDPILFGIPLFKVLIGATLFAALWYHRRPYYSRRVAA